LKKKRKERRKTMNRHTKKKRKRKEKVVKTHSTLYTVGLAGALPTAAAAALAPNVLGSFGSPSL
jgi:beta-lactamase regulating signal transducer with metallopeptidase domain